MTTPSPVHFLLVDDLEDNLIALEALLRREGLVLLKAKSGRDALEMLLAHEIALALIDVQMPEMDGFELAELMRGSERTRRVPIIFLTAGTPDQQRRFRGYEAGAVDFLNKPIEPHTLRSKAEVFFELSRERQEVARQRDELKIATAENTRLLEEARRSADALREADRRKDEFLATLAHELRNPLAPLCNGLQILHLSKSAESAARARAMMERQLGHMVRLVDDLLEISRVTSGKVTLRPELIEVRTVIEAAIEASRPAIEEGHHTLTVQLPDESFYLRADPTRLAQVVGNLLTNAAKYTPAGGHINVSAISEQGHAVIRVTDTGIGIPAEMLPHVFDLFVQVESHHDRSQGGLGIGLALVKRLVEMHRGEVAVESPGPNRGSTFLVKLPLANDVVVSEPAKNKPISGPRATGRRVLIVDDNTDAAESLSELLALSGHKTETAQNGPDAMLAMARFRPEIVFLDIGLPGMSGYDVARAVRGDATWTGTVLVALTGWGSEDDRRRSAHAGFDFHMVKPIESQQLEGLFTKLANDGR